MARKTVSDLFRVYYIACEPTGMGYVGITGWTIEKRFKRHIWNARRKRPGALYDAIREHGAAAFSVSFIEATVSWDDACERERQLIEELETKLPLGYNATGGGEGNYGYEYTDEVRARMSASGKLKKLSEEHRKRIGEANRVRPYNPVTAAKIAAAHLGSKATQETRAKMSLAAARRMPVNTINVNIGSKRTPEQRARMSAGMTGLKRTPEGCANMSIAASERCARLAAEGRPYIPPSWEGKTHSEETRAKMSATNKARWALRKAAKLAAG